MSEWQSYKKSNKEWQFQKLRNSLKLNKPYVHFLANNDDLGEIETIIKEYGYKIFYRDKLFFSTGLFLESFDNDLRLHSSFNGQADGGKSTI